MLFNNYLALRYGIQLVTFQFRTSQFSISSYTSNICNSLPDEQNAVASCYPKLLSWCLLNGPEVRSVASRTPRHLKNLLNSTAFCSWWSSSSKVMLMRGNRKSTKLSLLGFTNNTLNIACLGFASRHLTISAARPYERQAKRSYSLAFASDSSCFGLFVSCCINLTLTTLLIS